jgi:hypothetical protein
MTEAAEDKKSAAELADIQLLLRLLVLPKRHH